LEVFKRRSLVVIIVVAVTMSVVTAAGFLLPPVYEANAAVRVLMDVAVVDLMPWDYSSKRLLNTYGYILKSGPVLREALRRTSPQSDSITVDDLWDAVEVQVIPETELITIAVRDGNPVLARDLANTLADLLIEYAQSNYASNSKSVLEIIEAQLASTENQLDSDRQQLAVLLQGDTASAEIEALRSQIEIQEDSYDRLLDRYELARLNESLRANSIDLAEPALLPVKPANAVRLREVAIALAVGLFGGAGAALIAENLDTRIHSVHQIERLTNLPILGSVPRGLLPTDWPVHWWDLASKASNSVAEAYRLLALNLLSFTEQSSSVTILVTSAAAGAGKSVVTANLAQILSEQGQTTFLLEADMRRPTLSKLFGLNGGLGLSDLLSDGDPTRAELLGRALKPAQDRSLYVVASGEPSVNPTALLAKPAMAQVLTSLREQARTTLLDAPPVLGLADVLILAPGTDGVVFIVRQGWSKREQVREALKQLEATRCRLLGVIFVQQSKSGNYVYS
jgi:capsular exopolysaccharide synthesis family protein